MMKRLIAIGVATMLATAAQAGHKGHGMKMLRDLDLTQEQRQQMRATKKLTRQDNKEYRGDVRAINKQIRDLVRAESFDADAVMTLIEQRNPLKQEMALNGAQSKHKIWHIFSDEQQAKLKEAAADREPREKGDFERRGMRRLGLSDEQKAKMQEIFAADADKREQFKASMKQRRSDMRKIVQASNFDESAWRAAYAKYQGEANNMALIRAENRHQVWNLLTPEQQSKMERIAKKREKKRNRKGKRGRKG